jgi:hypothetical protein
VLPGRPSQMTPSRSDAPGYNFQRIEGLSTRTLCKQPQVSICPPTTPTGEIHTPVTHGMNWQAVTQDISSAPSNSLSPRCSRLTPNRGRGITLAFRPCDSALSLAVCIPVTVRTSYYCGYKRLEARTFKRGASRSFLGVGSLAWDVLAQ